MKSALNSSAAGFKRDFSLTGFAAIQPDLRVDSDRSTIPSFRRPAIVRPVEQHSSQPLADAAKWFHGELIFDLMSYCLLTGGGLRSSMIGPTDELPLSRAASINGPAEHVRSVKSPRSEYNNSQDSR